MRRLNMILAAGMLVTFLIHGIAGALVLSGTGQDAVKTIARICLALILAHAVVGTVLTIQTLAARKRAHAGYFRQNGIFWARRISGFTIIIPMLMHLLIFRASNASAYRVQVFHAGRLTSQIILIAAIALHVLTNIRPALIAFGIKDRKAFGTDILVVLSVVLFLLAAAFVVYYLRWMAV